MNNGNVEVLDKFEGAMIGNHEILDDNIFFELKKEQPTYGFNNKKFDYNLHFHFGIKNHSDKNIILNIFIECKNKDLKKPIVRLWTSDNPDEEYNLEKNIDGKTDFHGKSFFKIRLDANKLLYVSNFPPKKYSKIKKRFIDLSIKSNANEIIIGKTVENRTIKAYEYGEINHKPAILFVSGFHPPERDTIAIEAIMEKLTKNEWKNKVLSKYSFSLIPILNPDGFANNMQGSNANEINFHWKFFGNSIDKCPESNSIWQYCLKIKPIVFFDFHSFTFQDNDAMPYLIPGGYLIGKIPRRFQNDLNKKLKELCNGRFSKAEKILAPNLLSTKLRTEFGTITSPKFHLHMKNGIKGSKDMAISCLEIILTLLDSYNITSSSEILKKPYGGLKSNIYDKIRIKTINYWHFSMKSILRKLIGRKKR